MLSRGLKSTPFYLSIGSNLGDRSAYLGKAIAAFKKEKNIQILKISNIYETEPYGRKDQPFFLNLCVSGKTILSPQELFKLCRAIELKLGREKREKWGPRIIDIDILFYGDSVVDFADLAIPHKELHKRRFVLVPLAQIVPSLMHPISKKTIRELLSECEDNSIVRLLRNDNNRT